MASKKNQPGAGELPSGFTGTITVSPALRRNPKAPIYYSPVVDVRLTDRDLRLLSFIIPPPDPEDVIVKDGKYVLPILSQCELLVPPDTVEQLIEALRMQYQAFQQKRQASEAKEEGRGEEE